MNNKYNEPKFSPPGAPPIRRNAIDEELNLQITHVDKLHTLLGTLYEKLDPVLVPSAPEVDEKDDRNVPKVSPCANRLAAINNKLSAAIRKLSDILERCDL